VLKAYTQMASATKEPVSEQLRGLLSKIDVQSNKLLTLVQQLLDISKIENGSLQYALQEIPLNDFLQRQASVMRHILPHHAIVLETGEDVTVSIDELRMEQVLANLLGNAAKYSNRDTQITLTTSTAEPGLVTIVIRDQGRGMAPETLGSVFDKFYRAKDVLKSHSGLGMGLYITSKIISDHLGKIWVESEQGSGSAFYFTLPIANTE
jgi:signal transduction histidine kinase